MKKYFFKGVVSHRRVKSKKHGFDYPYRSIFLENIYNFQENKHDLSRTNMLYVGYVWGTLWVPKYLSLEILESIENRFKWS